MFHRSLSTDKTVFRFSIERALPPGLGNGHLTDVKLTVIIAGREALALLHSLDGSLAQLAVTRAASRHEILLSLGAGAGSSSPDLPPKALPRTSGAPPHRAPFSVLLPSLYCWASQLMAERLSRTGRTLRDWEFQGDWTKNDTDQKILGTKEVGEINSTK